MPGTTPLLTIQTASLYASGDASTFTGTGGPFGFSPWTSQFGGIVSSAGLAGESFNDAVYDVATGDELVFVIALQNLQAAAAYGVMLHDVMPAGFAAPADGINLSITDGAGTNLAYTGDLFAGGLTLANPVAAYDANSGANIALVTFSLAAGTALPGPYASLSSTAIIDRYAAAPAGANLAGATSGSAATTIVTAAPAPQVTAETDPSAVARGQTIAFDVTVLIPTGSLQDFTLAPITSAGATALGLLSSTLLSVGNGLQTGTTSVAADGSIHFGTVSYAGGSGSNAITARIVLRADGTTSGTAILQTVISALDPSNPAARWSANVASSVGVVVPPQGATLAGLASMQGVAPDAAIHPFASLAIASANQAQTGTLAITLDSAAGHLGNPGSGSLDAAADTFILTGALPDLQAAARQLTYTAAVPGTAHFTVTLIDAAGGITQDTSTSITATATQPVPVLPVSPDPLFDVAYYLAHNPDVAAAGVDPYQHYTTYGWHEGRNPSALFNTNFYLTHNPDVAAAAINPLSHFESNGWREGRDPSLAFSDTAYLSHNTDVLAAGMDPLLHYVLYGQNEGRMAFIAGGTAPVDPLIDSAYYTSQLGTAVYPTGIAAAQQAAWSYANGGWQQGLGPDRLFDTNYYLSHNPDVAAAHVNPLAHFEQFGWKEGRDPSAAFSTNKYLAAYGDVRAAGIDPLVHYAVYGANEGRAAFAV